MELAVPDTHNLADDRFSDEPSLGNDGVIAPDQYDQTTESEEYSNTNLISESSPGILPATQPAGSSLFGGDVFPVSPKRKLDVALPHYIVVDVDNIRSDSRMEMYLRRHKIDTLYSPSSGLLTKQSLFVVALQEPVHVIQRDGYLWCIAGQALLAEASRILTPPRLLPVLVYRELTTDALLKMGIVEQVIQPARHQMRPKFLKARVPVILNCSYELPDLFTQQLRDDEWAAILRRSTRWFAKAKVSYQKTDAADGA